MNIESSIPRIAGVAVNLSAAILCLTLAAAVATRTFLARPETLPRQVKTGDRVALPNIKFGPGDTVVLVLREGCHFCEASMPLYRQIVEAARSANDKRVVAVLPEPSPQARSYLRSFGLDIEDVYDVAPGQLQVRGTPTLLVLSRDGVVKRAWFGEQPIEQNGRIVREIFGGA